MASVSDAIFAILNQSSLTTLLGGSFIFPIVAPQTQDAPYIVFEYSGTPEDSKDGFGIKHHAIEVNVFTDKTKTKTAGVSEGETILAEVDSLMDRFSGTAGGILIDTIIQLEDDFEFDRIAQKIISTLRYRLREKVTAINEVTLMLTEAGDDLITESGDNLITE